MMSFWAKLIHVCLKRYEPINGFFHTPNFTKRFIFGAFGICCLFTSAFAQPSSTDNVIPHRLDSLIGQHYYSQPDSFWQESYQLLTLAKAQKQWHYALDVLVRMAWCADYHKHMDTLRYFLQQAETLATTHAAQLDSLDADGLSRTDVTYTRGLYYYTMGDYQAAIKVFKPMILNTDQQFLSVDSVLIYDVCSYIGQAYFHLSNYEEAITFHKFAQYHLPERHETFEDPYGYDYYVALNQLYLGECFWAYAQYERDNSESFTMAKTAFLQSLEALQHYENEVTHKNAILSNYSLLAQVYQEQEQYDSAFYFLQASLHLQSEDDIERADTYLYFGNVHASLANHEQATRYYDQSLSVIKNIYPDKHYRVAIRYSKLGEVYAQQQQWEKALTYYQQALSQLSKDFEVGETCNNPSEFSGRSEDVLQVLMLKGEAFNGLYAVTGNSDYLLCALEAYQLGVEVVDQMRQVFTSQTYKQFMAAKSLSLYEQAIATALKIQDVSESETQEFLSEAFFLAEKSKSAMLLEAVKNTAAQSYAGIPTALLEQEQSLKRELSYWKNEHSLAQEDAAHQLNQKILAIQGQYDAFVQKLEQQYPDYYHLKYDKQVVSLAEVQAELSENTCLLSYFYGDRSIYIFGITQNTFKVYTLPITDDLEQRLSQMLSMLNSYRSDEIIDTAYYQNFVKNANHLYSDLLAPLHQTLDTSVDALIILPNGPLGYLPFEALLTNKPPAHEIRYDALPYLLKQYKVSYEYSATLLLEKPVKTANTPVSYIGFAPAYENIPLAQSNTYRSGFAPLRFNREEVQFAEALFGGETYLGAHATEKNFKQVAEKGNILHLSMHAFADDKNPMYAGFAFTPQPNQEEDNFLHTYELYNLPLNAELAILSACETGTGQLSRGEGILSLGRAFKYAGCPNVAMSLWKVNDQTTGKIMQFFLENLKKGMEKDQALRQAKLDYLATADRFTAFPHHWAPFVLVGDRAPLTISNAFPTFWLIIGFILISGMLTLVGYRYFKKCNF